MKNLLQPEYKSGLRQAMFDLTFSVLNFVKTLYLGAMAPMTLRDLHTVKPKMHILLLRTLT